MYRFISPFLAVLIAVAILVFIGGVGYLSSPICNILVFIVALVVLSLIGWIR